MAYQDSDILDGVDLLHPKENVKMQTEPRPLTLQVVHDVETFTSLRDQWNHLVERSPATVFQSFDWLLLWWKHFGEGPDRALHILSIHQRGTLVGIFPMFLETKRFFGFRIYKRLRFLGSGVPSDYADGMFVKYGPSDFLDAIICPEYRAQVITTFIDYLQENPSLCDEIEFVNVPDGSILKEDLLPELEYEEIPYTIRETDICPRFHPQATVKEFLDTLGSNTRRRFAQARKTFSSEEGHVVENITSQSEMLGAFQDLVKLHQMRWNRMGYPGLFADARFERFQSDVLQAFEKSLWFKMARIDGARIAGRMGFKFKDRLYDYLSGFDDRSPWSKHRPGLVLLLSMIEDAIDLRYHSVEFLRGNEQYKFDITNDYSNNWQIVVKNPAALSGVRAMLYRAVTLYNGFRHRLLYELLLLRIQRQQKGFPLFLYRYLAFRVVNLLKKINQHFNDKSTDLVGKKGLEPLDKIKSK